MPIEIHICDGGIGNKVVTRGMLTDHELIDSLEKHLTHDTDIFKQCKYIFIDNAAATKVVFTDETVERVAGLCADAARANPDAVVAMVINVTMEADLDLINVISRMHELFVHQTCWETAVFRIKIEALNWVKKMVKKKYEIDGLTFD